MIRHMHATTGATFARLLLIPPEAAGYLPVGAWLAVPVGWGEAVPNAVASTPHAAWAQLAAEIGALHPYDDATHAVLQAECAS